jgi:hypothetical protein
MKKIDLLKMLERNAVEYQKLPKVAWKNRHMNSLKKGDRCHLKRRVVQAVVIDFINYVAVMQGVDLGLNSRNIGTGL